MPRPHLHSDILSLSDFRSHATQLIEQIHQTRRPLVITQHGRSAAVVITPQDYEQLLEKIEILSDIRAADADIERGNTLSNARAKKQVLQNVKKKFPK